AATTLRLLHELRSTTYHITVDGREYEAHAALVLGANCAEVVPPFVKFGRTVRPDDGILDVIALRADTLGQSVRAIWDLLREAEGGAERAFVGFARGAEVTVEAFPPQPVEFDGDGAGRTPFTGTGAPGAGEVVVPGGSGDRPPPPCARPRWRRRGCSPTWPAASRPPGRWRPRSSSGWTRPGGSSPGTAPRWRSGSTSRRGAW